MAQSREFRPKMNLTPVRMFENSMSLFTLLNCLALFLVPPSIRSAQIILSRLLYAPVHHTAPHVTVLKQKRTINSKQHSILFALHLALKMWNSFTMNAMANDRINCIQLNIFLTLFPLFSSSRVCSHRQLVILLLLFSTIHFISLDSLGRLYNFFCFSTFFLFAHSLLFNGSP